MFGGGERHHIFATFIRFAGGPEISTTFGNGTGEKSFSKRGSCKHAHRNSAGRFAEKCYATRIASKCRDVALYPLQSRDLVHQAIVAGMSTLFGAQVRMCEKTKRAQAIGDAHNDNAFFRQICAVSTTGISKRSITEGGEYAA